MELILEKMSASEIRTKYYPDVDERSFTELIALDPTYVHGKDLLGKYGKFLLDLAKKDRAVGNGLTNSILRGTLEMYEFLTASGMVPAFPNLASISSASAFSGQVQQLREEQFTTIYEDGKILLISTKTKKANTFFGCNAKWCTTWDNESHHDRYMESGTLVQLIEDWDGVWEVENIKATLKKMQCHFNSTGDEVEIKDETNQTNVGTEDWDSALGPAIDAFYAFFSEHSNGSMREDFAEANKDTAEFSLRWSPDGRGSLEGLYDGDVVDYSWVIGSVDENGNEIGDVFYFDLRAYIPSRTRTGGLMLHDFMEADLNPEAATLIVNLNTGSWRESLPSILHRIEAQGILNTPGDIGGQDFTAGYFQKNVGTVRAMFLDGAVENDAILFSDLLDHVDNDGSWGFDHVTEVRGGTFLVFALDDDSGFRFDAFIEQLEDSPEDHGNDAMQILDLYGEDLRAKDLDIYLRVYNVVVKYAEETGEELDSPENYMVKFLKKHAPSEAEAVESSVHAPKLSSVFAHYLPDFIFSKMTLAQIRDKSYPEIPVEDFYQVVRLDPTWDSNLQAKDFGGQFSRFLIERYKAGAVDLRGSGESDWRTALKDYLQAKKDKLIPANDDIMKYKNLAQLQGRIFSTKKDQWDVIYQSDGLALVHPKTQDASIYLGRHSKGSTIWCTAWPGGSYYASYAAKGPILIALKVPPKVDPFSPEGVDTLDKMQFYCQRDGRNMQVEFYGKQQRTWEQWVEYIGPAYDVFVSWLANYGVTVKIPMDLQYNRDYVPQWEMVDGSTEDREQGHGDEDVEENSDPFFSSEYRNGNTMFSWGMVTRDGDTWGEEHEELTIYQDDLPSIVREVGVEALKRLDISPYGCVQYSSDYVSAELLLAFINSEQTSIGDPFAGDPFLWQFSLQNRDEHYIRRLRRLVSEFDGYPKTEELDGQMYIHRDLMGFEAGAFKGLSEGEDNSDVFDFYLAALGIEGYDPETVDEVLGKYSSWAASPVHQGGSLATSIDDVKAEIDLFFQPPGKEALLIDSVVMGITSQSVPEFIREVKDGAMDSDPLPQILDDLFPSLHPEGDAEDVDTPKRFSTEAVFPVISIKPCDIIRGREKEFLVAVMDYIVKYLPDYRMVAVGFARSDRGRPKALSMVPTVFRKWKPLMLRSYPRSFYVVGDLYVLFPGDPFTGEKQPDLGFEADDAFRKLEDLATDIVSLGGIRRMPSPSRSRFSQLLRAWYDLSGSDSDPAISQLDSSMARYLAALPPDSDAYRLVRELSQNDLTVF